MGDFKQDRGGHFGGGNRGGFGGRDRGGSNFPRKSWGGGSRDRGPITMHPAVCDECKKPCEVPFRPTDGKPIYCNACFGGKREMRDDRGGDRFPRKSFDNYKAPVRNDFGNNDEIKKQLETLNTKIDQLIKTVGSIANTKSEVKEAEKVISTAEPKKKIKKSSKK